MPRTNNNDLEQTPDTHSALDQCKKFNILALPQEVRQRILLFSITDEELVGYIEISLLWHHSRPLRISIPYDRAKFKQWKIRLELVHSQIKKDMVWVSKRRHELAEAIPFLNDGRESRWAPGW